MNKAMVKTREGYHGGLRLPYLINLLEITSKSKSFLQLFDEALMSYKAGHLKYMRWLVKKKYIKKTKFRHKGLTPDTPFTEYKITKKGRLFLRMIK